MAPGMGHHGGRGTAAAASSGPTCLIFPHFSSISLVFVWARQKLRLVSIFAAGSVHCYSTGSYPLILSDVATQSLIRLGLPRIDGVLSQRCIGIGIGTLIHHQSA